MSHPRRHGPGMPAEKAKDFKGTIGRLLAYSGRYKFALFGALMMALPTASSSAMFASKYDMQPELAAQTVGLTTVISVITVPVIMQAVKFVVNLL